MIVKKYIEDESLLDNDYNLFVRKSLLEESVDSKDLVEFYLEKVTHNLKFVRKVEGDLELNDWRVIGLFYTVYSSCLALVASRGFSSKDYNSTIVFVMKNFTSINDEELYMIEKLYTYKNEFEFLPMVGRQRTVHLGNMELLSDLDVNVLKDLALSFIKKVEDLVKE